LNRLNELRDALHARANEPLAPHTTFRIGGPADLFVQAKQIDDLIEWSRLARQFQIPIFILGNGSNVLVRDGGIRGLVIENHCAAHRLNATNQHAILYAESGASLPGLANRLAREGWSGWEWSIGVPGTIGGAVIGNAGAHDGCIADALIKVTILDARGVARELPKDDCGLGYRTSRFKGKRDEVILSAEFELTRDDPQTCITRMNSYIEHRRRTQPTEPSVGSMFKNPPGDFAGRLIEQAGLKGVRMGNAQVSNVHANFFVNLGGASAREVLTLVDLVRGRVVDKFGVRLELEIDVVGEDEGGISISGVIG
jgi:UDP-N-acetylmuramate dehydrogenase